MSDVLHSLLGQNQPSLLGLESSSDLVGRERGGTPTRSEYFRLHSVPAMIEVYNI